MLDPTPLMPSLAIALCGPDVTVCLFCSSPSSRQGLEDLWHFPILFVLVLGFSAMVSAWSFNNRPELEDLHASMNTQFDMLLEILPEGYETDPLLAVYVVLSATVHFFLMLNFLLVSFQSGCLCVSYTFV